MSRQQSKARHSDWIWVPYFRRCHVSEDKVEVTPPVIFGRGFLFDRVQQMVTIRRSLLGWKLSEEELPFSDVSIRSGSRYHRPGVTETGTTVGGGTDYFIEMTIARGKAVKVCYVNPRTSKRRQRILAAIRKMGL